MNILGIDYGSKNIGLAIAYQEKDGFIVVGYKTLDNGNGFNNLIEDLKNIIKQERIIKIVVGLPIGLKGIKTRQTIVTEKFINTLKLEIDIPIVTEDERFTSALAKKMPHRNIHEQSARIILQSHIEKLIH